MSNDDDWVSNVKRWCHDQKMAAAAAESAPGTSDADDVGEMLGYEAAQPMYQAVHWPDAGSA